MLFTCERILLLVYSGYYCLSCISRVRYASGYTTTNTVLLCENIQQLCHDCPLYKPHSLAKNHPTKRDTDKLNTLLAPKIPIHTPVGGCCHARCCQAHWRQVRVQCLAQGHFDMRTVGARIEPPTLQ